MNQNEIIDLYLNNNDFLLKEWYRKNKLIELGHPPNFQLKSKLPSPEEIYNSFLSWIEDNKIILQKNICKELHIYLEQHRNKLDIIIFLINLLNDNYDTPLELSVLIVKYGIDKLCRNQ